MKDNLIIGRYIPGNSLIHRLDPRLKLVAMIVFMVLIFMANSWPAYLLLTVTILALILMTGISLGVFIRGLKPMLILIVFTVLLQVLFTHQGTVLWEWGWLKLTTGGIYNAIMILLRFVLIIFISTIVTLTTQPLALTDALESLFSPLRQFLPIHEIALMLSIALRFVPTLMEETDKIMDAQRARGVDFSEGNLVKRLQAIIPILIPLFISAFNRAYDLATAMEARGYKGSEGRTKYRQLHWQSIDTVASVMLIMLSVALIGLTIIV